MSLKYAYSVHEVSVRCNIPAGTGQRCKHPVLLSVPPRKKFMKCFGPVAFQLFGHQGNVKLSQFDALSLLFLLTLAQKYLFWDWKTEMFFLQIEVG